MLQGPNPAFCARRSPPNISLTGQGVPSISGTVNIGAGQTYTNLTNNDGLFQALNNDLVLTGDLTVNITGDLTGETGFNSLRNLTETGAGAGTYRILIKPSGGPRTISGSIAGELIKLNGADRVTIDGWTGSAIGVVPDPASKTVLVARELQAAQEKFAPTMKLNSAVAEGYLAAKVLAEGIRKIQGKPNAAKLRAALESLKHVDLGGFHIKYSSTSHSGSSYVDVAVIGPDGRMLR